VTGKARTK
jgi:DNA-binding MltR family transcriptional regulator